MARTTTASVTACHNLFSAAEFDAACFAAGLADGAAATARKAISALLGQLTAETAKTLRDAGFLAAYAGIITRAEKDASPKSRMTAEKAMAVAKARIAKGYTKTPDDTRMQAAARKVWQRAFDDAFPQRARKVRATKTTAEPAAPAAPAKPEPSRVAETVAVTPADMSSILDDIASRVKAVEKRNRAILKAQPQAAMALTHILEAVAEYHAAIRKAAQN